jgi:hypothetical protein
LGLTVQFPDDNEDKVVKYMDNKKTWGGRRPNAGRKKVGNAILYCRMPQEAVDEIKTSAQKENLAVGDYLIKQLGL